MYLLVLIDKVVNDLSPAVRQVDHVLAWIKYKLNIIKYQSGRWTTYWPDKEFYIHQYLLTRYCKFLTR